MKIGKTIKDLRHKRNMTQEALAERLNISVSAVSQWEMEKTMPDISMLPLLVDIFGVTADELLGLKGELAEQRGKEYLQKAEEYYRAHKLEDAISVMKDAYKEFPTHIEIIEMYAFYLSLTVGRNTDPMLMDRCIELNAYILDHCVEDVRRHRAIMRMCDCYSYKNDKETALQYARMLPKHFHFCAPYLIKRNDLLPDEEKNEAYRCSIKSLVWLLDEFILALADPGYQNKASSLSARERIDVLEQRLAILNAVFSDKALDQNYNVYETHRMIGLLYLLEGDGERAMDHLEEAYHHALKFKTEYHEGDCYMTPILRGYEARSVGDYNHGSDCALADFQRRVATQSFYKPLESNQRFLALKEKLQEAV